MAAEIFIGIDVARDSLEVAVRPTGEQWSVGNHTVGIAELLGRVRAFRPTLIVLEATGGLEVPVLGVLGDAGVPVVAANPRQVRDFAKATGQLAKTDAIDAQVLALFAEAVSPRPRPLPDARPGPRRASWPGAGSCSACSPPNGTGAGRLPAVRPDLQQHIRFLERRSATRRRAPPAVKASPLWRVRRICSRVCRAWRAWSRLTLLAELPELGQLPISRSPPWSASPPESRQRDPAWQTAGLRRTGPVRAVLYMAALVATRRNPVIRRFYEPLRRRASPRRSP